MIDHALVESKLADLQSYYAELMPILAHASLEIIDDSLRLHTVERLFQLTVDTAIDINTHLLASSAGAVPDDYQSTFLALAERRIVPNDFARRIAPSVGLRNLVVHRYGKVDLSRMIADIKNEIGQYQEYAKHVLAYIQSQQSQ